MTDDRRPWWQGAVGYEVYPRSFQDSNGDGIGDLEGIRRRLPYLSWLGVDAVWITPFYTSPGLDHGYDVADYKDVNPAHGTLADFDHLITNAHELGLRVIVDIVPNHSSSEHEWFRNAREGRGNPHRDFYIWKDPAPDGGPPNNWVSHFGGPAWSLDEASGQYWGHLFLPEQPDLNWENPAVADAFDDILRFWCDRGVDGFRIDVAHGVTRDPLFRDNPLITPIEDHDDPREVFAAYEHKYDLDQDSNIGVYERWNRVVEPYGAMLIGEIGADEPDRLARYSRTGALHTAFSLRGASSAWDPAWLLEYLQAVHTVSPDGISWVLDNHDNSRSVSRFGGGKRGVERSIAAFTFMACLGGVPFLWEGQELGLEDGIIAAEDLEDPIATRNEGTIGRDGTRTAMPWDSSPVNGFTTAEAAWLKAEQRPESETVAGQQADPTAVLHRYRKLLVERTARPDLWEAEIEWLPVESATARVARRGRVITATNLATEPTQVTLPDGLWTVVFDSRTSEAGRAVTGTLELPAETAFLLEA